MPSRRATERQVALLVFVFVATLVLLAGAWALASRASRGQPAGTARPAGSGGGTAGPASATASLGAPSFPLLTPDPSGDVPTIVLTGAGDIADCSSAGASQTADVLVRQPGWFFTAGDNAYENGSNKDFAACYAPTWGRVLDRTILPAAGNHDWNTDGAAGYRAYFGDLAAPDGTTWYSRDVGAWHVVVLDSDCGKVGGCGVDSPQGEWLRDDLTRSSAHCTLAIWHHPRFSSGEHGNDPDVGPFWSELHDAGADLIVNGHDHDYERFAPQDPSGAEDRDRGIREIVAGTGGGELRQFRRTAPNSEFRLAGGWGVLQLTLRPTQYEWEFLPAAGAFADAGRTPCH